MCRQCLNKIRHGPLLLPWTELVDWKFKVLGNQGSQRRRFLFFCFNVTEIPTFHSEFHPLEFYLSCPRHAASSSLVTGPRRRSQGRTLPPLWFPGEQDRPVCDSGGGKACPLWGLQSWSRLPRPGFATAQDGRVHMLGPQWSP